MNGKTLSAGEGIVPLMLGEGVEITLKGGELKSKTDAIKVNGKNVTLNIKENVKISAKYCCVWVDDNNYQENVKINIDGARLETTDGPAIYANGNLKTEHCVDVDITDGVVESLNDVAIYYPADEDLTIKGGLVRGVDSAVEFRGSGNLTISGGKFYSTANSFSKAHNGSGSTVKGAAVAVSPYGDRSPRINVTGGEFYAKSGCYSFWEGYVNNETRTGKTVIENFAPESCNQNNVFDQ